MEAREAKHPWEDWPTDTKKQLAAANKKIKWNQEHRALIEKIKRKQAAEEKKGLQASEAAARQVGKLVHDNPKIAEKIKNQDAKDNHQQQVASLVSGEKYIQAKLQGKDASDTIIADSAKQLKAVKDARENFVPAQTPKADATRAQAKPAPAAQKEKAATANPKGPY